jgi:hypothetical protein
MSKNRMQAMRWLLAVVAVGFIASGARAQGRPTLAESREVCGYVASRGPAIAGELVQDGTLDANNDGRQDRVSLRYNQGTMGGRRPVFWPAGTSTDAEPIETFGPAGLYSYDGGWLKHGNYVYALHFKSERHRHISHLGYVGPTMPRRSCVTSRTSTTRACAPKRRPTPTSAPRLPASVSSTSR